MSKGHANIAAIGTAKLNTFWGTNYLTSLKKGNVHAEVAVLKENLRTYRANSDAKKWNGVPSLANNKTTTFDADTEDNLKKFQELEGLTADGIYGQRSRNRMAAKVGESPKGYVRVGDTTHYINYNDTDSGISGDSEYRLDHSWVTPQTLTALGRLAKSFYNSTSKKLQINDCSLIDGEDTPEHAGHQDGKQADIRNAPMTSSEEKTFLQACVDDSDVVSVRFHTKHNINSNKIIVDSSHSDHFHVNFKN